MPKYPYFLISCLSECNPTLVNQVYSDRLLRPGPGHVILRDRRRRTSPGSPISIIPTRRKNRYPA